jgi:hypothetical protein
MFYTVSKVSKRFNFETFYITRWHIAIIWMDSRYVLTGDLFLKCIEIAVVHAGFNRLKDIINKVGTIFALLKTKGIFPLQ